MSHNKWENWEKEMKQRSEIPQKYKDMLQNVLNEMENETGNMYQFTINRFGNPSNYNCIVGEFKTRDMKVQVFDMDSDHKELEGIYDSVNQIENKLNELRKKESDIINEKKSAIFSFGYAPNKWDGIRISQHDDRIYYAVGGSISICEPRGKYKFI